MSNVPPDSPDDAPLNPALKEVRDDTYGADHSGTDPMQTVSIQKEEGRHWPLIWASATIICVIVAIVLIAF
jgi:hypothetical protein